MNEVTYVFVLVRLLSITNNLIRAKMEQVPFKLKATTFEARLLFTNSTNRTSTNCDLTSVHLLYVREVVVTYDAVETPN